jgi:hypothetical protein
LQRPPPGSSIFVNDVLSFLHINRWKKLLGLNLKKAYRPQFRQQKSFFVLHVDSFCVIPEADLARTPIRERLRKRFPV